MKVHYQDDPQSELHLPDEQRSFTLAPSIPGCSCGHQAALERKLVAPVGAKATSFLYRWPHTEATPWLSSSKEAVQHWRIVAALTK